MGKGKSMETIGRVKNVTRDFLTDKLLITFEIDTKPNFDELQGDLDIKAEKHRNRKSRNANSYLWKLLQLMAEATKSDRETIYLEMLKRYSRAFTFLIVKESALERTMQEFRTCIDLGEVKVNGQEGHQLQVFFGSSTFDSKEMSVLIDGVVSEAKELGIETLPPYEIERLKKEWNQ